ncbi:glycosyltransferase family 2 protein [Mesoplasma melaleucae]|uniref:Glycosyltransferase n=1 Tax=Mesoplasma melaleucae TaxID=81459 RepID=A0A2K8NZU2_9MOLU|nr:glycosyltransferase [Mesoplasma melaleucae]ATZ18261.1 glycosyltransferase [Mesoplasma melaleucae]
MLVSFIISSQAREDKLFKTINTLKKQTNDSYELIIIVDEPNTEKEAIDFIRDQFIENEKIMLIFNSKGQGESLNWNNGIELARGEYVSFLKEGDLINENYVQTIQNIIDANKAKIDLVEVQYEQSNLFEGDTQPLLETNKLYDLQSDKEVFAYITQEIYGKLFRSKFIKDFRITFKKNVRFDMLFLFMSLAHSRNFYLSGEVLFKHKVSVPKYSIFDIINQWPHVLNYYRRIGTYREFKDELNFASNYCMGYTFLNLSKRIQNPAIYKKSLSFVETKLDRKTKEFILQNAIFLENVNPDFTLRMENFSSFINEQLKKIG